MTKALSVVQNGQIVESKWAEDQIALIKNTICRGASNDQLKLFLYVAEKKGLDPFAKQIHAVFRKDRKTGKKEMTIQTGIDGYRLAAQRTCEYAGSDDPAYKTDKGAKHPKEATVTVYRIVQGQRVPFTATARWSEFYPGDGPHSFMWRKMPYNQLGKCAEALALRKGFPAELSGLYVNEEMHQADSSKDDRASELNARFNPEPASQISQNEDEIEEAEVVEEEPPLEEHGEPESPVCEICSTELRISKAGKHYFCPNFKDESQGKHTVMKVPQWGEQ